jgi:predicted Zn-dependent protease
MLARELRSTSEPVSQPEVQGYVRRLVDRLTNAQPIPARLETEVISFSHPEPIAFFSHLFVPAGFFFRADDEAEFAAMLAHTIGHLSLRHGIGQQSQPGQIPLMFWGGNLGAHAESTIVRNWPMIARARLPNAELEADRFAIELAARAGFPPSALRRYLERVQIADQPGSVLPPRETRLREIDRILVSLPDPGFAPSDEFSQVRETLRRFAPPARRPPTLMPSAR